MDCSLEYYICVTACAIGFVLCVAGTSGWGYFACALLWIACVRECINAYCVKVQCADSTMALPVEARRLWFVAGYP